MIIWSCFRINALSIISLSRQHHSGGLSAMPDRPCRHVLSILSTAYRKHWLITSWWQLQLTQVRKVPAFLKSSGIYFTRHSRPSYKSSDQVDFRCLDPSMHLSVDRSSITLLLREEQLGANEWRISSKQPVRRIGLA